MTESLDRAREHRAGLRAAMGQVESALAAAGPGRQDAWRKELQASLAELADALHWHVDNSEGEHGLLADIMGAAPQLADRVDRAKLEHVHLREGIRRADRAAEAGADVADLRELVVALLTDLVRHRQLGSDLVFDAYNIDIEAAD